MRGSLNEELKRILLTAGLKRLEEKLNTGKNDLHPLNVFEAEVPLKIFAFNVFEAEKRIQWLSANILMGVYPELVNSIKIQSRNPEYPTNKPSPNTIYIDLEENSGNNSLSMKHFDINYSYCLESFLSRYTYMWCIEQDINTVNKFIICTAGKQNNIEPLLLDSLGRHIEEQDFQTMIKLFNQVIWPSKVKVFGKPIYSEYAHYFCFLSNIAKHLAFMYSFIFADVGDDGNIVNIRLSVNMPLRSEPFLPKDIGKIIEKYLPVLNSNETIILNKDDSSKLANNLTWDRIEPCLKIVFSPITIDQGMNNVLDALREKIVLTSLNNSLKLAQGKSFDWIMKVDDLFK